MSKQIGFSRERLLPKAQYLIHLMQAHCHRVEVAGSMRRGTEWIHDIDIVVWARYETVQVDLFGTAILETRPSGLIAAIASFGMGLEIGDKVLKFCVGYRGSESLKMVFDVPVEVYLADPDGGNFEALWQMRTGSRDFNIALASTCKAKGWEYRAGYGIFNNKGIRMDDRTERGIITMVNGRWVEESAR
jgi:DNA polymerase/3'-5' exonuclease PolX